ncbi:MAG: ABC transporter permease subunit [Eubacterium sp.]|nr:ABC transporter permease subunit [Eubacterium sp.]
MAGFGKRFLSDKLAVAVGIFLLAVLLAGVLAPVIAPWDPSVQSIADKFQGPSLSHPLGTDQLGRDVLSRLIYGARTTMGVSLLTMAATIFIGTVLGFIAGYFRGWVDEVIMRICDVMLSFPDEVLILAIVGILGVGIEHIVVATVIAKWAWYTRMIRTVVRGFMDKNYIRFARVAGLSPVKIITGHLLKNAVGEILVLATLDTGAIILNISALSFLGLGVQPPTAEWGMMLNDAKAVITTHPGQMLAPGIAIFLVVAAFNFLGDSIQEAMNPRLDKGIPKKRLSLFARKRRAVA